MEDLRLSRENQGVRSFIQQVYMWMTLALLTTAGVALAVSTSPSLIEAIFVNRSLFFVLIIAEVFLVGFLSRGINKMSSQVATAIFFVYSVVNGFTFSWIFLAYDLGSISSIFFITAGTFGAMSLYGYVTKKDLSSIGNICLMGLIGLIIASIVNIFIINNTFSLIVSFIGVIIFVAITAYDTQRIKKMAVSLSYSDDMEVSAKGSILGALTLYLDFINLFIYMLRLFGRKR
ncbi:Bax inhibitor-1/YccA family protein [Clostridium felsineum]|uniref:Inner membrane protein YbhL n=1 Tax=Clostridium felsineum TaxID=36839 RepID=A0A1S8KXC1_9CLOT|nr:Bax inhibitor-1/YccA family protein [Clostridium felsineum]MCR3758422.1 Bax inhibitor-1/YccA family protein [Clostridium felsineum]URZ07911.1 Inner membrane protein YbhL [Clostridium felsineum]URZ12942.1 Inner membrane protein YbhL [Clostridium felsineum]URZ15067.1 Inner membrane protein YbhL [Clostridium felsineum DSM 794]